MLRRSECFHAHMIESAASNQQESLLRSGLALVMTCAERALNVGGRWIP